MNYIDLAKTAREAIRAIDDFIEVNGSTSVLDSIRTQMIFVEKNAESGVDPVLALDGKEFTYSILASRELCSPDELEIKKRLDAVSLIFDRR